MSDSRKKLNYITDYYGKYCTVFPNYINLDTKEYFYKNIIRKQKGLNEKHGDLLRIQEREEWLLYDSFDPLFTKSYFEGLKDDEAMYSQYMQNVSWSSQGSQLLNFSQASNHSSQNESKQEWDFDQKQDKIGLNDLFNAIANNQFDDSVASLLHSDQKPSPKKAEVTHEVLKESTKKQHINDNARLVKRATRSIQKSISSSAKKAELATHRAQYDSITPLTKSNVFQNTPQKCQEMLGSCINEDQTSPSFQKMTSSMDVKEHPSCASSKENISWTKQKYQKYINKRESASRGVFRYDEPKDLALVSNLFWYLSNIFVNIDWTGWR